MTKPEWHVQLDKAAQAFANAIVAMDDDQLFALSYAKDHVTQTNCWFVSYNLAGMASDIAANELQLRAEAQGTEARRAETLQDGSVHDGPVSERKCAHEASPNSRTEASGAIERLTDALIADGLTEYRRDYLREYLKVALNTCDLTLQAARPIDQQEAKPRGFYDAADAIMHFINSLDSEGMDANAVRSAIYHKCLELHPTTAETPEPGPPVKDEQR